MFEAFTEQELISYRELQKLPPMTLNQRIADGQRIGLTHDHEVQAVIMDIQSYARLLDRIEILEDRSEDALLAESIGNRIPLQTDQWIKKPHNLSRAQFFQRSLQGPPHP